MDTIPEEIIKEIIKYLNSADKYALLFVSKKYALLVGKQENVLKSIIKYGSVKQLLWSELEYDKKKICSLAALGGNLEILKYAIKNGCRWDRYTCRNAAAGGHLQCLKYVVGNGCPTNDTYNCAAYHGNLEIMKYAHENRFIWDEDTCIYAAKKGHLECLKYAHENGCSLHEDTCGNISEIGCEWDIRICENAAENGHLHILQYCYNEGLEWDGYDKFRDKNGNGIKKN